MRILIVIAMIVLFWTSNVGADCKSDCETEYTRAMEECNTEYNDPNDADQLQECLDQAKTDYDSCLDQCKEEWDTHED